MRLDRLLAVPALVLVFALAACGGGGGSSGGGAGSGVAGGSGATLRLVAVNRQALSPSASPRLQLFVERPAGADPRSFVLEESLDGVHFAALALSQAAILPGAILWEPPALAGAAGFGTRHYRVAAPRASNRVAADLGAFALPPFVAYPGPGTLGAPRAPLVSAIGGSAASTYLYAIADAEGTLVWLAESSAPSLSPAGPAPAGTITFVAPPSGELAAATSHLVTVVALDADGYGASAAPRVDFTTR